MTPARFPHSDTPGSTLGCQLPRAYRRLLRPSSALDAKASTMCPSQLVTHTTNPTPTKQQPTPTGASHQLIGTRQAMHTTRHKRTNTHQHNRDQHNHAGMRHKQTNNQPPTNRGSVARCSRPLSRSQTTTPHQPTVHIRTRQASRVGVAPKPQTRTA
jgi:hypothetical protein